jgi:hypothetical protein
MLHSAREKIRDVLFPLPGNTDLLPRTGAVVWGFSGKTSAGAVLTGGAPSPEPRAFHQGTARRTHSGEPAWQRPAVRQNLRIFEHPARRPGPSTR